MFVIAQLWFQTVQSNVSYNIGNLIQMALNSHCCFQFINISILVQTVIAMGTTAIKTSFAFILLHQDQFTGQLD